MSQQFITFAINTSIVTSFLSRKELNDTNLSKELRRQGIINTAGAPFELSQKQEIEGLISKGVFEPILYEPEKMKGIRIFNSRLVNEIKGKGTKSPYEKSRLVIQAYNDKDKQEILTQSPTIQRVSQRLILALAPSLYPNCKLYVRDISQAYVQSKSNLNRLIIAKPPKDIAHLFPPNTVLRIIKPLYGIPEAGTHWFQTYHNHHQLTLSMIPSSFDPCLLITMKEGVFGVLGIQMDDTLFLANENFATLESIELEKAGFSAKPISILSPQSNLTFNGAKIIYGKGNINLLQKDQADRIKLIDTNSLSRKQSYIEQRARGAYIATICQPEAAFDLSIAAQSSDPTDSDFKSLNKRLKWQQINKNRGIRHVPLDLSSTKIFVFVDGSFANNKDFTSQIGYIIVIANELQPKLPNEFMLKGNIVHWSSIKCKRITRSVLASELYAMVHGVDITIAISTTLKIITQQLKLNDMLIIVCTDSFSLYECMVKLGTTREKRLMIDIMAIRQSYERRELTEIRWINGNDNPADAMTKSNPSGALQSLVSTNELRIRVDGWVQRTADQKGEILI